MVQPEIKYDQTSHAMSQQKSRDIRLLSGDQVCKCEHIITEFSKAIDMTSLSWGTAVTTLVKAVHSYSSWDQIVHNGHITTAVIAEAMDDY